MELGVGRPFPLSTVRTRGSANFRPVLAANMSLVGADIDAVSLTEESKLLPHATDKSIRVNAKAKEENNRRSTNVSLWLYGGVHDAGAGLTCLCKYKGCR